MSGKPLIRPVGILIRHTPQCERILIGSRATSRIGRTQPDPWRKSQPCQDKEYFAGTTNNKTDRTKALRNSNPTAHNMDSTDNSRNRCRSRSLSDRRPCCRQFFDRSSPTPATQRFVTYRCESVPDLRVPDPFVKDSGKGLDFQKFAFAALNNWQEPACPYRRASMREERRDASWREQIILASTLTSQTRCSRRR